MADDSAEEEPDGPALEPIAALRAALDGLATQVAREHDRAKAREAVIDRLHQEVQRLRAGETRELLRPAIVDLRRLRDDLLGQARSIPEAMPRDDVAVLLESYADSVGLILERCGVVAARPQARAAFDPHRQQASGTAAAPAPDLDGTIATVLSDGYDEAGTGRMIAPARVIVYRHADAGPDGQGG